MPYKKPTKATRDERTRVAKLRTAAVLTTLKEGRLTRRSAFREKFTNLKQQSDTAIAEAAAKKKGGARG